MATLRYRFRLYIPAGQIGSSRAEPDLRHSLDACIRGAYELEVVDLRARPDLAEADKVMVAPAVIRLEPPPECRAIGELSDARALATALELPLP